MPSAPREQSMVNTDKQYVEDQRIQFCHHAAQMIPEENIQFFKNGMTGRSKFFVLQEAFTDDTIEEFKLVRAFECPTKPLMYLEVRSQLHKGTTATVIIGQDKPFGSSMAFKLKPVDTISFTEGNSV